MRSRIVLAAVTAAALLSLFAGTAGALRHLRFSERVITLLSRAITIEVAEFRIVCEVGLTLRLNEVRVAKRLEVIGRVEGRVLGQEVERERCMNGRASLLPFPWELVYLSFNGTLPNITGVNLLIEQMQILITAPLNAMFCLIEANVLGTKAINAGVLGSFTGFTLESAMVIQLGGALRCPRPAEVRIRGTFAYTGVPRTTTVTLV